MDRPPDTPVASIVMATYHRPQVLAYAIRSVLQSTLSDWELIVVGDGCTDDTERVVRAFADPRIRWHNLPENTGNQAAPNNAGVALARGEYLFFLNHDDLWFGDHLADMIQALEESGSDIVFSPVALIQHSGRPEGPPDPTVDAIVLDGVSPGGYDPRTFVIASSWAMRREVAERVGPWRLPHTTRLSPSQEWLHRASRAGCRIGFHPRVSVLCIHAGARRGSYLRDSPEHARAWEWVRGRVRPDVELLEAIGVRATLDRRPPPASAGDRVRALVGRLAEPFGAHPHAVERALTGSRKGATIAGIHHLTFSAPLLDVNDTVSTASASAADHLFSGWHPPEAWGRWTSGPEATLGLEVPAGIADPVLELTGHPLRLPSDVTFEVRGHEHQRVEFSQHDQRTRVRLPRTPGPVVLTIRAADATSPQTLGISKDARTLGFALSTIRLLDGAVG